MSYESLLVGLPAFLGVFTATAIAGVWVISAVSGRRHEISRLRGIASQTDVDVDQIQDDGKSVWSVFLKLGALVSQQDPHRVEDLRCKLRYAGFSHESAPLYFIAFQLMSVISLGLGCGLTLWALGWLSLRTSYFWIVAAGAIGYLGPSFWLNTMCQKRQRVLRNGLADAVDIMVLCVEGGLSLNAAIQWVTDELHVVHPELGSEFNIIYREIQLGLPAGDAIRNLADRCGLADVRDLASVLTQSDKLGAGIAKTLRRYADSSRQLRQQKAEENAQKTAVKILFPTILCIFPAIFIVLMGPAAFQLSKLFTK